METNKRKATIVILAIALLLGLPMTIAGLSRIWSREYVGNQFTFDYVLPPELMAFVMNTFADYCNEVDTPVLLTESTSEYTVIPGYGMTMITIQSETYSGPDWSIPLYLDFDFIVKDEAGDPAEGAVLQITGKYVTLCLDAQFGFINGDNPSFDIPTDTPFLLDMSQMDWFDCRLIGTGEALLLTFHMDASGIEESETRSYTYTYDLVIGIDPHEGV